jgi:hypothetical protein
VSASLCLPSSSPSELLVDANRQQPVKRDNVIGAKDQRTPSGPTGVMTRIKLPEDMTAPTIKRNAAK